MSNNKYISLKNIQILIYVKKTHIPIDFYSPISIIGFHGYQRIPNTKSFIKGKKHDTKN